MEVVTVSDHTKAFPKQRADRNLSRTSWVCPGGLHQVRHAWNTSPRRCPSQVTSDVSKRKEKKVLVAGELNHQDFHPERCPAHRPLHLHSPTCWAIGPKSHSCLASSSDPAPARILGKVTRSFFQTSRVRKVRAPLTPQGSHQELSDAPAQIWDVRHVFNHMGAKRNYWASFWVVAIYQNFSQIDWPVASLFHFDFQGFF